MLPGHHKEQGWVSGRRGRYKTDESLEIETDPTFASLQIHDILLRISAHTKRGDPYAPSKNSMLEPLIIAADNALRTLSGVVTSSRPTPRPLTATPTADSRTSSDSDSDDAALSDTEKALSGSLMRVNHVGEVCAQALYLGQSMATKDAGLSQKLQSAARDETDHLAWTQMRLKELGARPSLLNPVWYLGSFALGWLAGISGDATSLGFVVETERQVEQHLDEHLERLPESDRRSRAIVQQMKSDEARHAEQAHAAGATELPAPVRWGMRAAATLMTRTAHHL